MQELLKLVEEKEITKREFYELQKQEILRFNEYLNPIEIDLAISGSNIKSLDISISASVRPISAMNLLISFSIFFKSFSVSCLT